MLVVIESIHDLSLVVCTSKHLLFCTRFECCYFLGRDIYCRSWEGLACLFFCKCWL